MYNKNINQVSIKTIAKKSGFSISTVSRVINSKTGNYSKDTEEKVLRTIDELNYYPNVAARGLRNRKTMMIGFLTHYLSLFWMEFFKGAEYEAFKRGYLLILCNTENNVITENLYINALISNRVSGVIISSVVNNEENIKRLDKLEIPIVRIVDQFKSIEEPIIKINTKKAIINAIGHLKEQGYRSVGIIGPAIENVQTYHERFNAYKSGIRKYGFNFKEEYILLDRRLKNLSIDIGYDYMKEVIENKMLKAESYIIIPDSIAIGVMRAMKEAGYKIPRDIGIIGFDNITISNYCEPRLTSIEIPKYSMGKKAVDIILDLIEKKDTKIEYNINLNLIIRESTLKTKNTN